MNGKKKLHLFHIFLILIFAVGCVSAPVMYLDSTDTLPQYVAVLPCMNETNDVDAPSLVTPVFIQFLREKNYHVMDADVVEKILKDSFGITYGDMIQRLNLSKIAVKLKVQGLFFLKITQFKDWNMFYFRYRKVSIDFILFNDQGEKLWSTSKYSGVFNQFSSSDDAVVHVVDRQISRMDKTFLRIQIIDTIKAALRELPDFYLSI